MQKQLLDIRVILDPDEYKRISTKIKKTKLLASELGAWIICTPNTLLYLVAVVIAMRFTNVDDFILMLDSPINFTVAFVNLFYFLLCSCKREKEAV